MSVTPTRDAAAALLDTLRGATGASDAGEPVDKAMLEPAVALAEQLLEAAAGTARPPGPSAMTAMVTEFHEHPNSTGRAATVALTPWLHAEEHDELLEAIALDDPRAIARELGDVVYVAFSEAWARGVDLDAALVVEVHRVGDGQDRRRRPRPRPEAREAAGVPRARHDRSRRQSVRGPGRAPRGRGQRPGPAAPTNDNRRSTTMNASACTHTYDPHTGCCEYCGVELIIVAMTFDGLLDIAERILAAHYPADIFPTPIGDKRDAGVQLVTAVRAVVDARRR